MVNLKDITNLAAIALGGYVFITAFPLLKKTLSGDIGGGVVGGLGTLGGGVVGGLTELGGGVVGGLGTLGGGIVNVFIPQPLVDQPIEEAFPGATPWTSYTDTLLAEYATRTAAVVDIVTPGVGERQITTTPEMFLQAGNIITDLARKQYLASQDAPAVPTGINYLLQTAAGPGGVLTQQPVSDRYAFVNPPPEAGQYWVNPQSGLNLGAFIEGETPPSVERLRARGIYPLLRGD